MSHFVALPWVMETGSLPPLAGAGGDGLRLFAVSAGRGGARGVHGGGGCRRSWPFALGPFEAVSKTGSGSSLAG